MNPQGPHTPQFSCDGFPALHISLVRFSCSSTPRAARAALQFASALLQCVAKDRTAWHVNYDVAHNRTFGPCAPVPCIPVLRETPGLVGYTRPTRSRRWPSNSAHKPWMASVYATVYEHSGQAAGPDGPPRSSRLVDPAPPKTTWLLEGVHLAKRLSAGHRVRLAILRCATSTGYSEHCGRSSTSGSFASFPTRVLILR